MLDRTMFPNRALLITWISFAFFLIIYTAPLLLTGLFPDSVDFDHGGLYGQLFYEGAEMPVFFFHYLVFTLWAISLYQVIKTVSQAKQALTWPIDLLVGLLLGLPYYIWIPPELGWAGSILLLVAVSWLVGRLVRWVATRRDATPLDANLIPYRLIITLSWMANLLALFGFHLAVGGGV